MKNTLLIILVLTTLTSCNDTPVATTEQRAPENMYSTTDDDDGMNKAIATASQTLHIFDEALLSNKYDTASFALKVKFPTEKGHEHIWVTSITIDNGQYFGVVDNLPELITRIKKGDRIRLDKENITDWMYSDRGVLRGGYTIRSIRSRMPQDERAQFDADFEYKIED